MRPYLILLLPLLLIVDSCVKDSNPRPRYPKVTTIVEGRVLTKYTRMPVANVTITIRGTKPYESSTAFCLFCPDSTSFDIASTETDANGNYHLEGSTEENVGSEIVWSDANSYGRFVNKGTTTNGLNFDGRQYITLKEYFHVINNYHPPLAVGTPITSGGWIRAVDTSFITYGASLDTGVDAYNWYRYTGADSVEHNHADVLHIGGYADTLTYHFVVDPSMW